MLRYIFAGVLIVHKYLFNVLFKIIEHFAVCKAGVFYCFGKSAWKLSFGERFPRFNIKIYLFGLVEQTYQVSSQRSIDRCLSSDRCVCGGKQSSGIVDKRYASAECTCNKSCKVAYNTASDRNYTAVTAIALFKHRVLDKLFHCSGFRLFSFGYHKHIGTVARRNEFFVYPFRIKRLNNAVGNNGKLLYPAAKPVFNIAYQRVWKTSADFNIVWVVYYLFKFTEKFHCYSSRCLVFAWYSVTSELSAGGG